MWPWTAPNPPVTPDDMLSAVDLGYVYDTEIQRTPPYGGPHGSSFDDSNAIQGVPPVVTSISATWNTALTSVTVTYANNPPAVHGTPTGDGSGKFDVPAGQTIEAVRVAVNKQNGKTGVVGIVLVVSGQLVNPVFGPTLDATRWNEFMVDDGMVFSGFCGRTSNRVYSLGPVTLPSR